jgi:hypothetical protein
MRECFPHKCYHGQRLAGRRADYGWPVQWRVARFVIGHVTPEAFEGGTIAVIKNGDSITIDAQKRQITLNIGAQELDKRLRLWKQPKPVHARSARQAPSL